ncbi:MAG: menaquinone biosynthesis protein [Thermoguttaceae bacterium]|jgi:chorismate dehydratase
MNRVSLCNTTIRIGAVTYLNSRPLIFGLRGMTAGSEIVLDVPSRLADGLAAGVLDVALVPSIEYRRQAGLRIVSDACIACAGPVRSVKLYGRVPLARIRTLALDEGSRTSAALVRILLKERFGLEPQLQPLPLGATLEQSVADAVLVIGDRGMLPAAAPFAFVADLGHEWHQWTGLPFVFALWLARPQVELGDLERVLAAARDEGLRRLAEIADLAAAEIDLPAAECLAYLRDNLQFHLGPRERRGLALFFDLAARHGLAPPGGELVFQRDGDPR